MFSKFCAAIKKKKGAGGGNPGPFILIAVLEGDPDVRC